MDYTENVTLVYQIGGGLAAGLTTLRTSCIQTDVDITRETF